MIRSGSKSLYDRNREVYELLRYGVLPAMGENKATLWLIDWKHPQNNHFCLAEAVVVKGADLLNSANKRSLVGLLLFGSQDQNW